MAISPFVKRLRELVGHELLVLPSVSVLPRDEGGRLLLVRLIDTGNWATIGGAVEPDESPQLAACREAEEEAGVTLRLGPLLGVVGGPDYRVTYPNNDRTAYVVAVFDATVESGTARPDGDETSDVAWFALDELPFDKMGRLTKALLSDVGIVRSAD
jgi:8-oxo-dGTP pyrophosphatase MutT (NUDIX family)